LSNPATEQVCTSKAASSDDERRVVARFAPNVRNVVLRIVHNGDVVDESSSGIGLVVTSQQGLEVGLPVDVEYAGFPIRAEVRYIESTDEGRYRVGLRWVDPFIVHWADPNLLDRLTDAAISDET
jgi:hypothetical protein